MMGHYTIRAYNTSFPGDGIKTFQSITVWYGESGHGVASIPLFATQLHAPQGI